MSPARAIPASARDAQARASDPSVSAWVSANAGSGKTHVLAQRVIRLLLGGVQPAKILCLTFTKAAAANMAKRVYDTLGAWTGLGDPALSATLDTMTGARPSAADLIFARRLFARAVETPGGLKIQTIHAFCERLLHRFPFEANVAARFEVIEDLRQADLLQRARTAALAGAVSGDSPDLADALRIVTAETTAGAFGELIDDMIAERGHLVALARTHGGDLAQALARRLHLAPGEDAAAIERAVVEDGIPPAEWGAIARVLGADGPAASRLAAAAQAPPDAGRMEAYLQVFLKKDLQPRAMSYLSQGLRRQHPELCARLDAELPRLMALLDRRRAALAVQRTDALLTLGTAILDRYARLKAEQNLLDFDDLIAKVLALLTRSDAAWVMFKLDSGIDHILVDEAQDTSSEQWQVLKFLTEELTAGSGARTARRTFFAVGDEKQSIFSFQGAAPREFDQMRRYFEAKIRAAAAPGSEGAAAFAHVPLHLSFRSAPAVLKAVDDVFAHLDNFAGLSFDPGATSTVHESFKTDLPGRVEVWKTIVAADAPDPESWRLPLDVSDERDPPVLLARRIAATIKAWTAPGSPERVHDSEGRPRPMQPGDVLILVRVRNAFFEAMIRALKEHLVPVAGADRMSLTSHIAVMDLVAAGRAALLRDDDLSLACVLKSPLVGLADDDLLVLAPERGGSLADAVDADPRYEAAAATLHRWRAAARSDAPFDFYMRLIAREGGRRRLAARLGPEADDAIDEFLRLALEHERQGPPSLARFLASMETAELSVKRDMEAAGNSVRVMTVHAAKGLEAKVVILADTCGVPSPRHDPKLFRLEPTNAAEVPFIAWSARKADDPPAVRLAREAARRGAMEEHRRLLYVAMTRAEERLVIAGSEGKPKAGGASSRSPGCWYDMILGALGPSLAQMPAHWDPTETIHWRGRSVTAADLPSPPGAMVASPPRPDWLFRPAAEEPATAPPLKPSNALAAADRPDRVGDAADRDPVEMEARLAGILMHALLQHLPDLAPERRHDAAVRFLTARAGGLSSAGVARIIDTALAVLGDTRLAALFGAQSRAEAAIAGRLTRADGSTIAVAGQVDRMAVSATEVIIADFKTGRPRPAEATPEAYVTQLAVYGALIAPLYPGRRLTALLVWTAAPEVVEIGAVRLEAALRRITEDRGEGTMIP